MAIESYNDKLERSKERKRKHQRPYDNLLLWLIGVSVVMIILGSVIMGGTSKNIPFKLKENCVQTEKDSSGG